MDCASTVVTFVSSVAPLSVSLTCVSVEFSVLATMVTFPSVSVLSVAFVTPSVVVPAVGAAVTPPGGGPVPLQKRKKRRVRESVRAASVKTRAPMTTMA